MIKAPKPADDKKRTNALHRLNILDTEAEERFDRITRIAQKLFDVPIALVSLIDNDRQWFKSKQGLDDTETDRETSFCAHAILTDEIMVVEDTAEDIRFVDNPFVTDNPHVKFYLGCPLKINNQYNVGTLCLIDRKKRVFKADELAVMRDLANMVQAELEAIQLSTTDELTGLYNRRGFLSIANPTFNYCSRENKFFTLLFFDLNKFKAINDTFGHSEGDKVLKIFAQTLQENFRRVDIIARLGGDEFCILCVDLPASGVSKLIKRVDKSLQENNNVDYKIEFSVGCIEYNSDKHSTLNNMLDDADSEMYVHKKNKKRE